MTRHMMRPVERVDALELYVGRHGDSPPLLESREEENFELCFYLQVSDPTFFSATDLPLIHFDQKTMHFSPDSDGEVNISSATEHEADQSPADHIGLLTLDFPAVLSSGANCQINFSSRQTEWRYHLIPQSVTAVENITIVDESFASVEFKQASGQLEHAGMEKAITVALADDRPYQARYDGSLTLKCDLNSDGQSQPFEIPLPMGSPNQLKYEPQNPGEEPLFFSDIYVYL